MDARDDVHYLIIVHGTWNAPEIGEVKWYEADGSFSLALARELAHGPLKGAVLREFDGKRLSFSWSGENTHAARLEGAGRLCELMLRVRAGDPDARIHLVSHSHGGNVVIKAIELYLKALYDEAERIGRTYIERLDALGDLQLRHTNALVEARETLPRAYEEHVSGDPERFVRSRQSALDLAAQAVARVTWRIGRIRACKHSLLRRIAVRFMSRAFWIRDAGDAIAISWCSYEDSHRLGRLVFLGTPFLHKRWRIHDLGHTRLFAFAAAPLLGAAFFTAAVHYALLSLGGLLCAVAFNAPFIGLNVGNWPGWMLWLYLPELALVLAFLRFEQLHYGPARANTNHYFDIQNSPAKVDGRCASLESLVVTAGQLDEALLALSAEPLLYARMMPLIEDLTLPKFASVVRPRATGVSSASISEFFLFVGSLPVQLLRVGASMLASFGLVMLRPVLLPYLEKTFVRVIAAAASGLPPGEMSLAHLQVTETIAEPRVFCPEWSWDVSRQFADESIIRGPGPHGAARYRFLWDEQILDSKAHESETWKSLEGRSSKVLRRFDADEHTTELRRLKRVCLMVEERIREIGGTVELAHSRYYGNPAVIAGIARFLESGEPPEVAVRNA